MSASWDHERLGTRDGADNFGIYGNGLQREQHTFGGVIPFLYRILKLWIGVSLLLVTSAGSYGLFYQMVMPSRYATEKVYFQYPDHHHRLSIFETKHREHQYPYAEIDLFARNTPWEALVDEVVPVPIAIDRLLQPRQSYYIEVILSLPESQINKQAGVFTIETELSAFNSTKLALSKRATMLPHESGWIANVRKTLCLIPLVVGAIDESRTVTVPAFRHFVESRTLPIQHIHLRIVPPIKEGSHEPSPVEIISGEVRIGKELNRYQEFLKEWFYTCFFFGTMVFTGFYLILFEILREQWLRYNLEEPPCDIDLDADQDFRFESVSEPTNERHPDIVPDETEFHEAEAHGDGVHFTSTEGFPDDKEDEVNGDGLRRSGSSMWEDIFFPYSDDLHE